MKRLVTAICAALFASFLSGCMTMREIGQIARASAGSSVPRVDFPVLRQLGIHTPPRRIMIANGVSETSAYCEIWVYDRFITVLGPGDIAYNRDVFEPFSSVQIPVVARCFSDQERNEYLGVAYTMLTGGTYARHEVSTSWTFGCRNIVTPGRKNACSNSTGNSGTNLEVRRVEFGRFLLEGTSLVQFVNNRASDTAVITIGEMRVTAAPRGGMAFISGQTFSHYYGGNSVHASVLYVGEDGTLKGNDTFSFSIPSWGVWGRQVVVSN